MSNKIITGDYQIDLLKRRVYRQEVEITIRPKSFELLKLLLLTPNQVVSKNTILMTIWDDVNVDEQVIFQSIKELRKAFSAIDAIKTFPRKGYAWVADVSVADDSAFSESSPKPNSNTSTQTSSRQWSENRFKPIAAVVIFCVLCFGLLTLLFLQSNNDDVAKIDGSIIVLPIKAHLDDRDHKWVKIGGMDLLIQQIPPSKDYGVMQVDDVLEIMKRAQMSLTEFNPTQIDKLFQVSGAELIIEAELSGSPGDYQLVYTLRRRQSIDRGVLITSDIDDGIDQLANLVAKRLGTLASSLTISRNKLVNQLLAQALDAKNIDDYQSAEQYLTSLLAIAPTHFQARRLLAEISVYLKKTQQINDMVVSAEQMLDKQMQAYSQSKTLEDQKPGYRQREYGRLKFWQGLNELQFKRVNRAEKIFLEANTIVNAAQDWLYLGYLAEAQGHLYRTMQQYDLASEYYNKAIINHRIIKCPFGEVNNLLNLAENAFLNNDVVNAKQRATQALTLAKKRELTTLFDQAKIASDKYNLALVPQS
ncbi:winged helix-turn-helix domain-containing protein [Thalassotalea atypica]|uniref:winged helix-turn-helix domain-containing protein n=1 Tax=Thalassotalea atypica TaxID=2054316 RepID=UPI002572A6CD|nr:winged helix-turn-helix domain-containing protein [Thalassotalea atypica]